MAYVSVPHEPPRNVVVLDMVPFKWASRPGLQEFHRKYLVSQIYQPVGLRRMFTKISEEVLKAVRSQLREQNLTEEDWGTLHDLGGHVEDNVETQAYLLGRPRPLLYAEVLVSGVFTPRLDAVAEGYGTAGPPISVRLWRT